MEFLHVPLSLDPERAPYPSPENALVVENLRFHFAGNPDIVRIDQWSAAVGENVLIIGPSGCGKTTLLHLLAGLLVPQGRTAAARRDCPGNGESAETCARRRTDVQPGRRKLCARCRSVARLDASTRDDSDHRNS